MNVETWIRRLSRIYPVTELSMELVKFDTQLMENAEISGVEYQQGMLQGYETKEYLLEKWGRKCAYCGIRNSPLQVDHIIPRSRGGSHRISNLTLACGPCNQLKGNKTAAEFGFPGIQKQAKSPLKDAAAMNATRWFLYRRLTATGLPVETGSGGLTKFNRTQRGLPKSHWIDAACVGKSTPDNIDITGVGPLSIKATGHNSRQMCRMDKFGFPRTKSKAARMVKGFRTGDIVEAVITSRTKAGRYVGRVVVRASGYFKIRTNGSIVDNIGYRYCRSIHKADGYGYI